jgi:outer membrane immunogenic protein
MQGDGYYGDVTARIGFAPKNMLYYMEGGAVFADLGWSVEDDCAAAPCDIKTINATSDGIESGWTAGVGIAYAFWQHASLRLDYAYIDLGEIAIAGTSGANTYTWKQDVTLQTVTAGLSFMF